MGHHTSQTICEHLARETPHARVTALATISIAGDAFAQRSMKEMMNEMKAKYPRSSRPASRWRPRAAIACLTANMKAGQ